MTDLSTTYRQVRAASEALAAPLHPEDMVIQSMPDVSPTRWHLAHTSWFFETFVLVPHFGKQPSHPDYCYLFNSYYEGVGAQFPRSKRGLLSRPSVAEILAYRKEVDDAMLHALDKDLPQNVQDLVCLGLQHEQQHQELMATDIKHVMSINPLCPAAYALPPDFPQDTSNVAPLEWSCCEQDGICEIGHAGEGFHFDCEAPRHKALLQPHEVASRPISNGEYLEFVEAGGYGDPRYWHSDGWALIKNERLEHPIYWFRDETGAWHEFTLHGLIPLCVGQPVCHLSWFEASAYLSWRTEREDSTQPWRMPSEAELECHHARTGDWSSEDFCHDPQPPPCAHPKVMKGQRRGEIGSVWEWTASAYSPYPGFRPSPGAIGEYNGKFMSGQMVLRGGSCLTPAGHSRPTYRNFFPPSARWQMTGIRPARDL